MLKTPSEDSVNSECACYEVALPQLYPSCQAFLADRVASRRIGAPWLREQGDYRLGLSRKSEMACPGLCRTQLATLEAPMAGVPGPMPFPISTAF